MNKPTKYYSKIISCRHCGNISKMEVIGSVTDPYENFDPEYGFSFNGGCDYSVLKCPACDKVNIVTYSWHEDMESDEEYEYEFLYPENIDFPKGLPDEILKALMAAEKVKNIDVNAYAILIRRLLELICIDRNATHGTLASMLSELANKNEIPSKLVNVARGLKDFGNIGAHVGSGQLTENEIPILNALCTAILEYVYSAPYLASIAENKLNAIKNSKNN